MRRRDMFTSTLVALAFTLILGACAPPTGAAGDTGSSPDGVVSSTPGADPGGRGGAQRVEPRDGLLDVRSTTFDKFLPRDGGRAVDLYFWSGIEECYGVDRVDVTYARKKITVTIYEGRDPGADTCIELAVRKVVRVELDEDLGTRDVVDGGS